MIDIQHISSSLFTLLFSIFAICLKKWQQHKKNKYLLKRNKETSNLIYDKLEEIKNKLNADRVYILEYNRNNYYWKSKKYKNSIHSIKSISTPFEIVNTGISKEKSNNISVNIYNDYIVNEYISIDNINNITNDTLKKHHLSKGNKSVYGYYLSSIEDINLGILMIDYTHKYTSLNEDDLEYLKLSAEIISGYM